MIDATDLRIGEIGFPSLAVGEQVWTAYNPRRTNRAFIPTTVMPGDYYLGGILDLEGINADFDLVNNIAPREPESPYDRVYSYPVLLSIVDPVCPADAYEQDDSAAMASLMSPGETRVYNFCEDGYDWVRFEAVQGQTYTFRTEPIGSLNYIYSEIYRQEGEDPLVQSDRPYYMGYIHSGAGYLLPHRLMVATIFAPVRYLIPISEAITGRIRNTKGSSVPAKLMLMNRMTAWRRPACWNWIRYNNAIIVTMAWIGQRSPLQHPVRT